MVNAGLVPEDFKPPGLFERLRLWWFLWCRGLASLRDLRSGGRGELHRG